MSTSFVSFHAGIKSVRVRVDAHLKPLKEGLEKADLLITTGGTSMGATDLLKPLIERNLNGKIHFGRVAIKPGACAANRQPLATK